jgi:hypothetical protein
MKILISESEKKSIDNIIKSISNIINNVVQVEEKRKFNDTIQSSDNYEE